MKKAKKMTKGPAKKASTQKKAASWADLQKTALAAMLAGVAALSSGSAGAAYGESPWKGDMSSSKAARSASKDSYAGSALKWIKGQDPKAMATGAVNWMKDHPKTMIAAGTSTMAIAAYLADQYFNGGKMSVALQGAAEQGYGTLRELVKNSPMGPYAKAMRDHAASLAETLGGKATTAMGSARDTFNPWATWASEGVSNAGSRASEMAGSAYNSLPDWGIGAGLSNAASGARNMAGSAASKASKMASDAYGYVPSMPDLGVSAGVASAMAGAQKMWNSMFGGGSSASGAGNSDGGTTQQPEGSKLGAGKVFGKDSAAFQSGDSSEFQMMQKKIADMFGQDALQGAMKQGSAAFGELWSQASKK